MIGNIARLPYPVREQLNRRLDDAGPRRPILDWLNSLPEVQTLLAADFEGDAITPEEREHAYPAALI